MTKKLERLKQKRRKATKAELKLRLRGRRKATAREVEQALKTRVDVDLEVDGTAGSRVIYLGS